MSDIYKNSEGKVVVKIDAKLDQQELSYLIASLMLELELHEPEQINYPLH